MPCTSSAREAEAEDYRIDLVDIMIFCIKGKNGIPTTSKTARLHGLFLVAVTYQSMKSLYRVKMFVSQFWEGQHANRFNVYMFKLFFMDSSFLLCPHVIEGPKGEKEAERRKQASSNPLERH